MSNAEKLAKAVLATVGLAGSPRAVREGEAALVRAAQKIADRGWYGTRLAAVYHPGTRLQTEAWRTRPGLSVLTV